MSQPAPVTAAILVIGDEILSGRTQDTNTAYIARFLGALGIDLREARVVPDIQAEIVAAVNALRARYTYVFTTGGIGPTHDDITFEAIATAFCLSTDATGVAIQPTRLEDGKRQPCRKGHFFVTLADKDHVFLDFQAKHTSLTVWNMFKGFSGYVQADAHVIYDALFKGAPPEGAEEMPGECGPPPIEVGCFSHARRKYWEAAICRHPLGLDGVRRIDAIFDADRELAKLAPAQRKERRDQTVRPLVDAFFTWARCEYAKLDSRGLVATALGYSVRQEQALRRFLDDGRLRMENNSAERELRAIAVGRRAWMFYGSDDHAGAAGNILSLVASCKLHDLDPELYLTEIIRIVPYWPRNRYLELAPKYWARTRARLDPCELELALGHVTVPPPAQQQSSAD